LALSFFVKYIYNNGSEDVIKRGKKIHATGQVEMIEHDDLMGAISFRVKDDAYSTFYRVNITKFKDPKGLTLKCTCPYNATDICRHKVASLFQLQELLDRNMLGDKEFQYSQQHTIVKMKVLDLKMIKLLCSQENYQEAEEFLRAKKATIISAAEERVTAELELNGMMHKIILQKNEERNFDTSCGCDSEYNHPLCVHKTIVFLQLLNAYGPNYFDTIRNWDKDKNKLLAIYGYSLSDNLKGKFEFTYTNGKPFLRVLDSSIKRVATNSIEPTTTVPIKQQFEAAPTQKTTTEVVEVQEKNNTKIGVVFSYQTNQYPFLQVDAIIGEMDETELAFTGKVEKVDLAKFIQTEHLTEDDKILVQHLRKLLPNEIDRYLSRNSPFSGIWENIVQQLNADLPEETKALILEYILPKYKKLFEHVGDGGFVYYLPEGKTFITNNLQPISLSSKYVRPEFIVHFTGELYEINAQVKIAEGNFLVDENEVNSPVVFKHSDKLYLWDKTEDIVLLDKFKPTATRQVTASEWPNELHNFVLPLAKEYSVQFSNIQKKEIDDVLPEIKIELQERGEYLLFHPIFSYLGYTVKPTDKEKIIIPTDDKLLVLHRNEAAEKAFMAGIQSLHSNFIVVDNNASLALKGADVLKNNWFFLFIDAAKEKQITVLGFEALRNFRFNTAKPSTKIYISSRTDWFDAKVDIFFGEQKVTVADVKKALANKQQFINLQDGTLGILPEEWIKKYALLFRVGDGKNADLKLSKYHFSVIEDLYEQRDEEELVFQLEEKYEKLKELHGIQQIPAPQHLKAILRPYQESGFQWLNYLNEVSWGGILADDMGLGKTIQTLTFLEHLKTKNGVLKAIVVCPTTLMYNWKNEINKFTPSLTHYIHHGGSRDKDGLLKNSIDIIITTYGTLRSDIKHLIEIPFDYVVLDESQAIKNPSSKVTKAATLLKSKNRLCLSGTPLQNNTFDIYAQMSFLNPGMLGSVEFFKQEFAIPIDKFGEKEQKEHLRKLLYPFILRRTKEQVAKDLPAKTEMILYCEMGKEQREIYDAYRNDFRDKIMGVVEKEGVNKSQLTILQGLMKLRQICDSPAIVNEEEKFPNVSVKLEEIGREIQENISNHKALIFSQFLGMLALIKQRLEELEIPYAYFDGSTTATDREKAIRKFQEEDTCRVFLISLKAGGVGLNLTAADYVYIVDPWWNPAVEQQAIDRTHRIGQTKNIFAYRMICTDTVEDKILKLQEHKKLLAADLITDDSGFVKSLSKEDIEYLFS